MGAAGFPIVTAMNLSHLQRGSTEEQALAQLSAVITDLQMT